MYRKVRPVTPPVHVHKVPRTFLLKPMLAYTIGFFVTLQTLFHRIRSLSPSPLFLMNIHHKKPVGYDAVVQKFAEQQTLRILLADPIFEESCIFNLNEFKTFIRLDYCQC